jgi:2,4-diketo-3-deoxy-L-fuconate hydrolase
MKLARLRQGGKVIPVLLLSGTTYADISQIIPDIDGTTIQGYSLGRVSAKLDEIHEESANYPRIENPAPEHFAPIIGRPPNIIGIGLNYGDHCRECNYPVPETIEVFMKHTGSICGPNDPVILTPRMKKLDYEVELVVVIGKATTGFVPEERALEYVAGYCAGNDVSERAYQLSGKNWTRGKSAQHFSPIGPVLVTADEIPDPQGIKLELSVNGQRRQQSSTSEMIFSVARIISQLSESFGLLPGDIIFTGTPPGVALRMNAPSPYPFLQVGDVVEWSLSHGLGSARHTVIARP